MSVARVTYQLGRPVQIQVGAPVRFLDGTAAVKAITGPPGKDGAPGPAGPAEGMTLLAATGGISALKVVRGAGAGVGAYADNDTLAHQTSIAGVSTSGASAGDPFAVRVTGLVQDAALNLDTTKPVFLGKNGALTQDLAQAEGAFLCVVGYPTATDAFVVRIAQPVQAAA